MKGFHLKKGQPDWLLESSRKDCEHGGNKLIINSYCGLSTDPTVILKFNLVWEVQCQAAREYKFKGTKMVDGLTSNYKTVRNHKERVMESLSCKVLWPPSRARGLDWHCHLSV